MTHSAKIIADSVSPDGVRLTTMEVVFPRIVLAEFNTHRMLWGTEGSEYPEFSRNSASSRAIPVAKMLQMVQEHPYIPTHWGKNQKGMQADEELSEGLQRTAEMIWIHGRDLAARQARALLEAGVHKQITNRLLEPFMWHTCIVTATEWDNFFHLRMHPAAHPEIRLAAEKMHAAMGASTPRALGYNDWHTPYVDKAEWYEIQESYAPPAQDGFTWEKVKRVSTGRCARVSYLTHDGVRSWKEDVRLHDDLLSNGHMSPFEHVARPMGAEETKHYMQYRITEDDDVEEVGPFCGNFRGWMQYRKLIPHEHDIKGQP